MTHEEKNDAAVPWDYAGLCKKDIKVFVFVMIAVIAYIVASVAMLELPVKQHNITPQQIEADYAGRMFLQGRINSIDEDELERMSPAIKEAVLNKL